MVNKKDLYRIGNLGKPHGVEGEISFQFDDDVFDRTDSDYLFVEIDGLPVPFFIEEYRFRSDDSALMKFEGIDTQEQATELTGCDVLFPRNAVPDEDEDEGVSKAEIIGFTVINAADGAVVGKISAIDDSTANPLFEVETSDGKSHLIPASPDLIKAVDRKSASITIAIPEGLLSL